MEYTEEIFLENFINDYNELGEDAQYIYEEIFSSILNEKVDLSLIANPLSSPTAGYNLAKAAANPISSPASSPTAGYNLAKAIANPTSTAASEIINPVSGIFGHGKIFSGLTGMFSKLKNKIGTLFAGLKGKSFSEILSGGLGWLKNPANMPAILGTAGGAALLIMVLRALKKRKKMKDYKNLQRMALSSSALKESYEDEFDWTNPEGNAFARGKNLLVRECKKNKKLREAVFGKPKVIEENYFGY